MRLIRTGEITPLVSMNRLDVIHGRRQHARRPVLGVVRIVQSFASNKFRLCPRREWSICARYALRRNPKSHERMPPRLILILGADNHFALVSATLPVVGFNVGRFQFPYVHRLCSGYRCDVASGCLRSALALVSSCVPLLLPRSEERLK